MDSERFIPILGVLLGVVCAAILVAGPVVMVWDNLDALPILFGGAGIRVEGQEESQRKAIEATKDRLDREARIQANGLNERYEIIPYFGDTRERLYEYHDFDAVDARFEEQFEKRSDPFEFYLYGRYINIVIGLRSEEDPEAMLAVLDEWVESRPLSYRALMLRGMLRRQYAWYHRGTGYVNTISAISRKQFKYYSTLAQDDLERAHEMNPDDPNPSASLLLVAMGLGSGRATIERHYQEAISVAPYNLSARTALVTASLPQWGGSWAKVDAIVAESEASSQTFPILLIVKREAEKLMWNRSPEHKAALSSSSKQREWAEPYLRQMQYNPENASLKVNAAYYAAKGRDFDLAEVYFQEIGDRYYEDSNFRDLLEFNDYRAWVHAKTAYSLAQPACGIRIREALDISPDHYYTNYAFGRELMLVEDHVNARRHLELSRSRSGNFVPTLVLLAQLDCYEGRREEAVRVAQKVLQMETPDVNKDVAREVLREYGS